MMHRMSAVDVFESLGGAAGVGALGLSVYNFIYMKREPVRSRQRELQAELRDLLYEVERECSDALSKIRYGRDVPPTIPPGLARSDPMLDRLQKSLIMPADYEVERIEIAIQKVINDWEMLAHSQDHYDDASGKKLRAAEDRLKASLTEALPQIKQMIDRLTKMEKGQE